MKTKNKIRVLFIVPYPQDCAPSQRLKFEQYYSYFEKEGVECIKRPFMNEAFYRIVYQKKRYLEKIIFTLFGYVMRCIHIIEAMRCDVVYLHLEAAPLGPPFFEYILHKLKKPIIYDIDDIVYLPHASKVNSFIRALKYYKKIPQIIKLSSHVITVTSYLKNFCLQHNTHVTNIPPTIDTDKYSIADKTSDSKICIGWTGSHSTSEYLLLLENVLRRIAQKYDIRIKVIGDQDFKISGLPVEAKEWCVGDEIKDIQDIDIGLYPLPKNEWIMGKGGLKALQYMGMGIPTVATRIGAVLDFIQDGTNGFLADSDEEWIQKLSRLIEDIELRKKIGISARKTVEERFSVKANAPKMLEIIRSVYKEHYKKEDC